MRSLFLDALSCKPVQKRPVWLMRQAGRYLPEYLEFRKKHSLYSCFHDPVLAANITKMPLARFDFDAAILFSDLLVLAEAWGKYLVYPESGGPFITPSVQVGDTLCFIESHEIEERLSYVFDTIRLLQGTLPVPLIGFCGAPFTLLCYMLQGKGEEGFAKARFWVEHLPEQFTTLLDAVCDACIKFAKLQIAAGVQAFQVFDSWANLLSEKEFSLFALSYWKKIQDALSIHNVPLLFFSRANSLFAEKIASISPTAISFDEGDLLVNLRRRVPSSIAIQGNFSPQLLRDKDPFFIREAALEMVDSVSQENGIIWNLGHGVLPKTPLANVEAFLEAVRS